MPKFHRGRVLAPLFTLISLAIAGCDGGGGDASSRPDFSDTWLIPVEKVVDGGPGKDGIPAIDRPIFEPILSIDSIADDTRVILVQFRSEIRAYPHDVLNWHEIVNDGKTEDDPFCISYCPLTGTSVVWKVDTNLSRSSYGVSGLLYNSNLILYDRESDSRWSQMQERSIWGTRSGEPSERMQAIETLFSTARAMYPNAVAMTRETSYDRNYDVYPYDFYQTNEQLLFPVEPLDERVHRKRRVIGVQNDSGNKVYQIDGFATGIQTINDQVGDRPLIVIGSSDFDIAAIYDRQLSDGTILNFSPIQDDLPRVMTDSEGNVWDVFGTAVSGVRAGEQLTMTNSYVAMFFAWGAFYPGPEIHFN